MSELKNKLKNILFGVLRFVSKLVLWRFKPKIIAVTGSAGKTSSKEAIWAVLSDSFRVRKSAGNFNNELGVPLAILGGYKKIWRPIFVFWIFVIVKGFLSIFLPKRLYPDILVLEYGADKPGDISKLVSLASPDIGVITSIGDIPVHVEFYPTGVGAVIKEKAKIISGMSVNNIAVINYDDKNTKIIRDKTRAKIVGFGFSSDADYKISNFSHTIENNRVVGINFKIENKGSTIPIKINGAFSMGHAYAIASAMSVAGEMGMNLIEAAAVVSKNYLPVSGRSVILEGIKDIQIIDESYNSSPIALSMALMSIGSLKHRRRVGILGDMTELGGFTQRAHERIGKIVPEALDVLITVGDRAKFIANSAIKNGFNKNNIYVFQNVEETLKNVKNILKKEDIVLVKGSRVVGLDKIVDDIKMND